MKLKSFPILFILLLYLVLTSACRTVQLPEARGYSVIIGTSEYYATSIKIHGKWAILKLQHQDPTLWVPITSIQSIQIRGEASSAQQIDGPNGDR